MDPFELSTDHATLSNRDLHFWCIHNTGSMMSTLAQLLFSGLTVGSIYALVALGFIIIYNASEIVNFAQGEFVMLGGMTAAFAYEAGAPLYLAAAIAIVAAIVVGMLLQRLAIEPARDASLVTITIITIGASIFIRGVVQVIFDKQGHRLPAFWSETPLRIGAATILPQSIIVVVGAIIIFALLYLLFSRTLTGKGLQAMSTNRDAARLVGINIGFMSFLSFGLSAAVGAIAGILVTPITLTSADIGVTLALKGFAGAMLGGMGSPLGAVVGGLLIGMLEAMTAGYLSSAYKDAVAFVVIIVVLFVMPQGLFGKTLIERV